MKINLINLLKYLSKVTMKKDTHIKKTQPYSPFNFNIYNQQEKDLINDMLMEIITIKKMMYSVITSLKNIKITATKVETYITTPVMDNQTKNTTKKYKKLYKTKINSSNSIQV